MALITCPECGQIISDKAAACPYCGLPLQLQTDAKKSTSTKKKTKYGKIVFLSIWAIITAVSIVISVFSIYSYCKNDDTAHKKNNTYQPKDETYLYEWMTEHGTLADGTILQYTDTDSSGNRFTLIYDPSRAKQARWYIDYENSDKTSFKRSVRNLSLFDFDGSMSTYIKVVNVSDPERPTTEMPFWHNVSDFTRNSPVVLGDPSEYFSTEWWGTTRTMCEDYAQPDLCVILDWLKNEFCPTANMRMSDFGYGSYK